MPYAVLRSIFNPSTQDSPKKHMSWCSKELRFAEVQVGRTPDDTLVEEMIHGMYEAMMAFDRERAEGAMDLTVRRSPIAGHAFRSLLKDMQTFRS